jgi:hypothetical protein
MTSLETTGNSATSNLANTASYVALAQTASFVATSSWSSFSIESISAATSQDAVTSSYATTASYVALAQTASFVATTPQSTLTTEIRSQVSVNNASPVGGNAEVIFGSATFGGTNILITSFAAQLTGKQFGVNAFISITQYQSIPNASILYFTSTLDSGTGQFTIYDGTGGTSNATIMYTIFYI